MQKMIHERKVLIHNQPVSFTSYKQDILVQLGEQKTLQGIFCADAVAIRGVPLKFYSSCQKQKFQMIIHALRISLWARSP